MCVLILVCIEREDPHRLYYIHGVITCIWQFSFKQGWKPLPPLGKPSCRGKKIVNPLLSELFIFLKPILKLKEKAPNQNAFLFSFFLFFHKVTMNGTRKHLAKTQYMPYHTEVLL